MKLLEKLESLYRAVGFESIRMADVTPLASKTIGIGRQLKLITAFIVLHHHTLAWGHSPVLPLLFSQESHSSTLNLVGWDTLAIRSCRINLNGELLSPHGGRELRVGSRCRVQLFSEHDLIVSIYDVSRPRTDSLTVCRQSGRSSVELSCFRVRWRRRERSDHDSESRTLSGRVYS